MFGIEPVFIYICITKIKAMHLLFVILESLNILVFGHSFGVDCTEYLPSLAVEAGITNLKVGRFIKANCSLQEHYEFFLSEEQGRYSECAPGQTKYKTKKLSVKEVVAGTRWDYVIFQNSLENEGRYETAQPYLDELIKYIRDTQDDKFGKLPTICWNMFWPISKLLEDGSHKVCKYRLSFYDNSSDKMWAEYIKATQELMKDTGIKTVIPSGTAVMIFRGSKLNTPDMKELTRDGYHMAYGAGRYLAACTLFEKLLFPVYHKHVVGNRFRTDLTPVPVLDDHFALDLQKMAAQAVKSPFKPVQVKLSSKFPGM